MYSFNWGAQIEYQILDAKYIIFPAKSKKMNLDNRNVFYDANDPKVLHIQSRPYNPFKMLSYNHENKNCRQYKLQGIYSGKILSPDYHVENMCNKLIDLCTVLNKAQKTNLSLPAFETLYLCLFTLI